MAAGSAQDTGYKLIFSHAVVVEHLLLEFQRAVDPWLALRILVYAGLLYQDLSRMGEVSRGEKRPAVFPLVIYNGRDPWGASRALAS
ncbi:Rpn family recombination-promoting nuclease/putative transposase [Accumulibacter sp.]|uniref:Rpn family recombination-promoting nuclease/putative transposase n=1 Tax=Accumulibacter sp. TaxID=2053492 RepID=UPI003DA9F335